MNATSHARPPKQAESIDEGRAGAKRTVAPTRERNAGAASRGTRPARKPETKSGPVTGGTAGKGDETAQPLWEDDGGPLPPEEWS